MSLFNRGLNILEYSPEPDGGDSENKDTTEVVTKEVKDTSTETTKVTTKPDKTVTESTEKGTAPQTVKTETPSEEEEIEVTDDDYRLANKKMAIDHRRIKRENAGLSGQVESMQQDAEDAPVLRDENSKLKRENMILKLAGKHGLLPELLEPIEGTEEEVEKWIQTFTTPLPKSGSKPDEKPKKKIENESDIEEDDNEKRKRVIKKPSIPDVDDDRPEAKLNKLKSDTSDMTTKEKQAFLKKRI